MRQPLITFLLCCAAMSAMSACAEQTQAPAEILRDGDPLAAMVDGSPIYASDVRRAAASEGLIAQGERLPPGSPVFERTLDALVDQRLLMEDAVRSELDRDPEALRRLSVARERILGNLRVERMLAEEVTDEKLRALYEAQNRIAATGPERRIRQIVVADEASAVAVTQQLEAGEDFADVATALSMGEGAERGGDMGWTTRGALPPELRGPVFALADGARTAFIKTADGLVMTQVTDRRSPDGVSNFEDVREDLARFRTFQAVEELMTGLRKDAEIVRGDNLPAPDPKPEPTIETTE